MPRAKPAQRVVHPIEPTLKAHRYVAVIFARKNHRGYRFLHNRAEVRELKKGLKPGVYVEIFKATHDFKEAWIGK